MMKHRTITFVIVALLSISFLASRVVAAEMTGVMMKDGKMMMKDGKATRPMVEQREKMQAQMKAHHEQMRGKMGKTKQPEKPETEGHEAHH